MPDVVYHGWTHRPKELGGTDPIDIPTGGQWCRLGFSEDYTIVKGGRRVIDFDVEANHDPDYFEIVDAGAGGDRNAIQILKDGTYGIVFGLYADVFSPAYPTNSPIFVSFQHLTWTHEEEVFVFPPLGADGFNYLASPILTAGKTFRSGPDFDQVEMCVTIDAAADSDLVVIGGDLNISYMEIVRLSGSSVNTDPNDTAVFPP